MQSQSQPQQQTQARQESRALPLGMGTQTSQAQPQPQPSQQLGQEEKKELPTKKEQEPVSRVQDEQAQAQAPPVPPKSGSRLPEPTSSASDSTQLLSPPQHSHDTFDSLNQQPMKSPSESLSSILSAYSRSDTASIIRSSDGTAYSAVEPHVHHEHDKSLSQAASHQVKESVSSLADSFPPPPPRKSPELARKQAADGKRSPPSSSTPPPPPTKDDASQRPSSPPKPLKVGPELGAPSPPRQQIWERRSTKGSRELPTLRLDYSHGSTASTSSMSTITQKPLPAPKPSPIEGSPAEPEAQRSQEGPPKPPAKDDSNMGMGSSKINKLKQKFHMSRGSNDTTKSGKSGHSGAPAVNRPPTPEYQKEEEKTPLHNSFVSPVSPASSPEPHNAMSPQTPNASPQQRGVEGSGAEAKPISRKAVPLTSPPALQPTKSMPDLKKSGPSPTREPMPPVSALPSSGRNSPAPGPYPPSGRNSPAPGPHARGRQPMRPSGPPGAFPPSSRASSARPSSRGSVRPGPRPQEDRWANSPNGDLCYRGRDGTLYPEMKAGEPDVKAMNFPLASAEIPEDGTIFKPVAIKQSHYNCYHRHKTMLRRANRRYPLACQVCDKGDTEDRFSCTFCYLRMCEPCLKSFDSKGRDLRALMQDSSKSGTLSLSSPTRPGSALGLQVTI